MPAVMNRSETADTNTPPADPARHFPPNAPPQSAGKTRIGIIPLLTVLIAVGGGVFLWQTGMSPVLTFAGSGASASSAYGGMADRGMGTNALGRRVTTDQFAGRYLWVEYSAPWCGHCPNQARQTRSAHRMVGSDVAFLTILTSEQVMQPATVQTAERWARRHRLDERFVVAGGNTSMPVPQHRLYGPGGELLYSGRGLHSSAQIAAAIRKHTR